MIVSTECPYCHKAIEEIIPLAEKYGYRIKVIFYGLHKEYDNASKIISNKISFWDYATGKFDFKKLKTTKAVTDSVMATTSYLKKEGIMSMPFFILEKSGRRVAGADMKKVEAGIKAEMAE